MRSQLLADTLEDLFNGLIAYDDPLFFWCAMNEPP